VGRRGRADVSDGADLNTLQNHVAAVHEVVRAGRHVRERAELAVVVEEHDRVSRSWEVVSSTGGRHSIAALGVALPGARENLTDIGFSGNPLPATTTTPSATAKSGLELHRQTRLENVDLFLRRP